MQAITFDALSSLNLAGECRVAPLPTIFALRNSGVHVGSSDGCNEVADIEASVD